MGVALILFFCLSLYLQACRGFTITLAFIDEANFINPKNYPSVLAYAISSDCKLIFCSSINTQSGDKHNILKRWSKIQGVNYVELAYVCAKHVGCIKFFPESVRCPCRSLYTPAHVDVSSVDKEVSNRMVEDSYLHEIAGGVARGDDWSLDARKPFNDNDLTFVKTVPFDTSLLGGAGQGAQRLQVYVYIDPSFQTSSQSGTAMAAVCRIGERTAVLAAEHYFLPDSECGNWCPNITRLVVGTMRFVAMSHASSSSDGVVCPAPQFYVLAEANLSSDAIVQLCRGIKRVAAKYLARSRVSFYHRQKKHAGGQTSYQLGFYLDYRAKRDIFTYFVEEVKARRFGLSTKLLSSTVRDLDVRHYIADQLSLLVCDRRGDGRGGRSGPSYSGKAEGRSDDLLVALACSAYAARHLKGTGATWLWE